MLVIELDGKSHDSEVAILKDKEKDKTLQSLGFAVMRIRDEEVMHNISGVALGIETWIREHHPAKMPSSP